MFKFILAIIVLIVIVYNIIKHAKKAQAEMQEPDVQQETPEEKPVEEHFPHLDETVVVPPQEECIGEDIPKQKEYYDLHGEPYEVFTTENGAKYIIRKTITTGREYRDYLNEKERRLCYFK